MGGTEIALLGFVILFVLLFIRMPVGLAMMLVGTAGIYLIRPQAALPALGGEIFSEATDYPLTIIPLFVLMGNLAGISGMSRDLYDAAHSWLGHFRGGLASATIVGCAGFSALSGSSLAAAVTMGRVSLPEMKRYNYDDGLATGSIAAGGTLGILIPPFCGFCGLCHPDRIKYWASISGRYFSRLTFNYVVHHGYLDCGISCPTQGSTIF
ncbi:TRAP transporter permease [Planktomarina temperata]|nr:TRAP transporter permease [Planktomarina temperata]